ncbi:MAG: 50S ribosomal protein L25/general stress protein Ctc [Parachlamydiaceae bacterium]|nr:50S ribosomal protein L25/general stress protein Ctc [Parachlamydiaceae bacterium]
MKLQMSKRSAARKSESKAIRRAGNIPAILYTQGKPGETVAVPNGEFQSLLRQVQPGRLSTTVFTLIDENGKERRAIIKEIQYEPTTYKVSHLDFEELHKDVKINLNIPIECTGVAECAGIKLGGVLRQVIRSLRVRCLPKDMPAVFELDIRNMANRESKRLSDLAIPKEVSPLANMNEVAVVIVKR